MGLFPCPPPPTSVCARPIVLICLRPFPSRGRAGCVWQTSGPLLPCPQSPGLGPWNSSASHETASGAKTGVGVAVRKRAGWELPASSWYLNRKAGADQVGQGGGSRGLQWAMLGVSRRKGLGRRGP